MHRGCLSRASPIQTIQACFPEQAGLPEGQREWAGDAYKAEKRVFVFIFSFGFLMTKDGGATDSFPSEAQVPFAGPRVEALAKRVGWSESWSKSARPVGDAPRVFFGIQLLERCRGQEPEAPVMAVAGIDMAASPAFKALRATMPAWTAKKCAEAIFENATFATGLARATLLCWADAIGLLDKALFDDLASEETVESWRFAKLAEAFHRGARVSLMPGKAENVIEVDQNGVLRKSTRFHETSDLCLNIELPDTGAFPWSETEGVDLTKSEMTPEIALKMAPFVLEALEAVAHRLVGREAIVVSAVCETLEDCRSLMDAQQERLALQDEIRTVENDAAKPRRPKSL